MIGQSDNKQALLNKYGDQTTGRMTKVYEFDFQQVHSFSPSLYPYRFWCSLAANPMRM
jgi:hypothetical protein